MSWVNLPADQGTDWTALSFLNQFVHALNERRAFTPGTWKGGGSTLFSNAPLSLYEAGDICQSFALLQEGVEETRRYYVDASKVGFPADPIADYLTQYDWLYDLAGFRSAAGLHADGFLRKFPREIVNLSAAGSSGQVARNLTDGLMYVYGSGWTLADPQPAVSDVVESHGIMQPGDYIGPWVFNELQASLKALRQRTTSDSPSGTLQSIWVSSRRGETLFAATWEDARAEAYADWLGSNRGGGAGSRRSYGNGFQAKSAAVESAEVQPVILANEVASWSDHSIEVVGDVYGFLSNYGGFSEFDSSWIPGGLTLNTWGTIVASVAFTWDGSGYRCATLGDRDQLYVDWPSIEPDSGDFADRGSNLTYHFAGAYGEVPRFVVLYSPSFTYT